MPIWFGERISGCFANGLLGTKDIDLRFRIVEDFLISEFQSQMAVNPCVAFAIGEMTERPDALNIARMNEKIGYSKKHFAEMFRRQVGVTPKSYLKIMRFQKAVKTIDAADQHRLGPDLARMRILRSIAFHQRFQAFLRLHARAIRQDPHELPKLHSRRIDRCRSPHGVRAFFPRGYALTSCGLLQHLSGKFFPIQVYHRLSRSYGKYLHQSHRGFCLCRHEPGHRRPLVVALFLRKRGSVRTA